MTHAACAQKPVVGGGTLCVPPGAAAEPIDSALVEAFFVCIGKLQAGEEPSPDCRKAWLEFRTATGCGSGSPCSTATSRWARREEPCTPVTDATECEATRLLIPCPDWPAPEPISADAPAPLDAATTQPGGTTTGSLNATAAPPGPAARAATGGALPFATSGPTSEEIPGAARRRVALATSLVLCSVVSIGLFL